ncbi:hypothetical protein LT068_19855, partial [Vibrio cholerae]|nr:hypothetical protein [Vibrio cholerae]
DALLSDKVTIVTAFSAQSHLPIRYPLAQLNDKAASAEWVALSLKVAGYATLWLLPIGIGLAWVLARTAFIGKGLIDSLV